MSINSDAEIKIKKAILANLATIKQLSLVNQQLAALLPPDRQEPVRGYISHPVTGKKIYYNKSKERRDRRKRLGLSVVNPCEKEATR